MYSKETARKYLPIMAALIAIKKQKKQIESRYLIFPEIKVDQDTNTISIGDQEILLPDRKFEMTEEDVIKLHEQIETITSEKVKDIKVGFNDETPILIERGERGERGFTGKVGMSGKTGKSGKIGAVGKIGSVGTRGKSGDRGVKGERGKAGDDGARGYDGKRGLLGEQGDRGEMGLPGIRGEQGLLGEQGDRGEQGEQGKRGKDFDQTKIDNLFDKVNKDFNQFKIMINNQLDMITSSVIAGGGGAAGGGGSVNILQNDDVIFQRLDQVTDQSVLIFNKTLNKFEVKDINEAVDADVAKFDKLIDEANTSITYIGEATPGTANTAALWRIQRIDAINDPDLDIRWADGVATFTKIWDDRATFSY